MTAPPPEAPTKSARADARRAEKRGRLSDSLLGPVEELLREGHGFTDRRIDEIVKPGVNLNPADTSYGEQVLAPVLRRR